MTLEQRPLLFRSLSIPPGDALPSKTFHVIQARICLPLADVLSTVCGADPQAANMCLSVCPAHHIPTGVVWGNVKGCDTQGALHDRSSRLSGKSNRSGGKIYA